jgi:hypothetical protein
MPFPFVTLLCAILAACTLTWRAATAEGDGAMRPIAITAEQIRGFAKAEPERTRFGRLEWRGGLTLTAADSDFGGWSGLVVDAHGTRLAAVSDRLHWLKAEIVHEGSRIAGLADAMIGPLAPDDPAMKGIGHDRDAEAIALVSGTLEDGEILISFERKSRLARMAVAAAGLSPVTAYLKPPPEAKAFPENKGFEAATIIAGGALAGTPVAIAERTKDPGGRHLGWLWIGGEPQPFTLTSAPDYEIADAASLPDGTLIVLERRASWLGGFAMRLRLIDAAAIRPDAVIGGDVLLEADNNFEVDNMEGLAVSTNAAGETLLTLISDDNFSYFLQRTIILQFALDPR